MPALVIIAEDVGARTAKCAVCDQVIGIVDFIVRAGYRNQMMQIDYVHLDCDPDVKRIVDEERATKANKRIV